MQRRDRVGGRAEEDDAHERGARQRQQPCRTADLRRPTPSARGRAARRERLLALVGVEPVEEQDAVEVVDLVLEHARRGARRPRSRSRCRRGRHPGGDELGPDDLEVQTGTERQPSSYTHSPVDSTISGLTQTCGPSPSRRRRSAAARRPAVRRARRPTASYIVSYIVVDERGEVAVDVVDLLGALLAAPGRRRGGRGTWPSGWRGYRRPRESCPAIGVLRGSGAARRGQTRSGSTSTRNRPSARAGERSTRPARRRGVGRRRCTSAAPMARPVGPNTWTPSTAAARSHATSRPLVPRRLGQPTEGRKAEEPPARARRRPDRHVGHASGCDDLVVGDPRLHEHRRSRAVHRRDEPL